MVGRRKFREGRCGQTAEHPQQDQQDRQVMADQVRPQDIFERVEDQKRPDGECDRHAGCAVVEGTGWTAAR
jgi:hypothetical protein